MSEDNKDDRRRDGGTNFILRIKEQETCLTLHEHDDDDDDDDDDEWRQTAQIAVNKCKRFTQIKNGTYWLSINLCTNKQILS